MAGAAATTSAPASTGSAIAASLFNDQPFDIWYRDNNSALAQVDIYNSSVTGINDVVYTAGWINDTFKMTDRLTLNFGVRIENYRDEWPDQTMAPNGIPALAGWTDPRYTGVHGAAGRGGDDRGQHHDPRPEGRLRV